LSLLNAISGEDIAVCVRDFDAGETTEYVVQELLLLAGIPLANIDLTGLTGTVFELVQIDENDSYINKAAEIAYSNGFVLYQDNDGIIKVKNILELGAGVGFQTLAGEMLEYQQKNDTTALPPSKINVLGNRLWPINSRKDTNNVTLELGEFSPIRTTLSKVHNSDTRTIVTTEKIRQTIFNETTDYSVSPSIRTTERTVITETYELKPPGSDCKTPDEGRLLKRVTSVYQPFLLFLDAYYNEFASYRGLELIDLTGVSSTWLSERTTETWEYNMPRNETIKTQIFDSPSNSTLPEVFLQNSSQYFVAYRSITRKPTAAYNAENGRANASSQKSTRIVGNPPVATQRSQSIGDAFISKGGQ